MKKVFAWLTLLAGLPMLLYAANTCTNTDQACYVTGPYGGTQTTVFRVDASGNTTQNGNHSVTGTQSITGTSSLTGNVTHGGGTIYTQQQVVSISSFTTITPTSTYLILSSTGSNITMAGAGSNNLPVIATATATNGQFIVLTSTSNGVAGAVTVASGTASGLDLGSATRALANGKYLGLMFSSFTNQWMEQYYGSN